MLVYRGCSCYSNIRRRGAAERQAEGRTLRRLRCIAIADPDAAGTGEEEAVAAIYPMLVRRASLTMLCGVIAAGCAYADNRRTADPRLPVLPAGTKAPPGTGGIMLPPGDAEVAVRSEFAGMEKTGTAEAYALFAERHPDHPLGREAARKAAALRGHSVAAPNTP